MRASRVPHVLEDRFEETGLVISLDVMARHRKNSKRRVCQLSEWSLAALKACGFCSYQTNSAQPWKKMHRLEILHCLSGIGIHAAWLTLVTKFYDNN
jgi:hypothetical protein